MQKLNRLISNLRNRQGTTDNDVLNLVREYLQVLVLKAMYSSKYAKDMSFMGGTCLRICHDLKRYSEDLDFALDRKTDEYSFEDLNAKIASFLKKNGFEVDIKLNTEGVVQKSFIRVHKVLRLFDLSPLESQKVHIKLEIDTNPTKLDDVFIETFFVTKFDEMFPILKHTDDTLFAGKICAIISRAYTKGRDFYDLMWYLNRKTPINIYYINRTINESFASYEDIMSALNEKILSTDPAMILKDIDRFLEDQLDRVWLGKYHEAFKQASKKYFEG